MLEKMLDIVIVGIMAAFVIAQVANVVLGLARKD